MLIIVGRGEVTAGPHGTAAVGLRLKTLCAFPVGRYLHPGAWCIERKLVVKMITVSHVTAAEREKERDGEKDIEKDREKEGERET